MEKLKKQKELMIKKLITFMFTLASFSGFASIAEQTKEELAKEVAHCYVANQRGNTALFKSGEAEKMRGVIADLVGSDNINKTIQIADRTQRSRALNVNGFVHKDIKKFCRPLDKVLIDK